MQDSQSFERKSETFCWKEKKEIVESSRRCIKQYWLVVREQCTRRLDGWYRGGLGRTLHCAHYVRSNFSSTINTPTHSSLIPFAPYASSNNSNFTIKYTVSVLFLFVFFLFSLLFFFISTDNYYSQSTFSFRLSSPSASLQCRSFIYTFPLRLVTISLNHV